VNVNGRKTERALVTESRFKIRGGSADDLRMSIGLDTDQGHAPGLAATGTGVRTRATGSLNGSSIDTAVPPALADAGLQVRAIVKDASVVGLACRDVSMVLIHDRLVIVPIPAYLARDTGFTVVEGYPEILFAAGVVPDELQPMVTAESVVPESVASGHAAQLAAAAVDERSATMVSTPRDFLTPDFDPDAPVAAARRIEEVGAAHRIDTLDTARPLGTARLVDSAPSPTTVQPIEPVVVEPVVVEPVVVEPVVVEPVVVEPVVVEPVVVEPVVVEPVVVEPAVVAPAVVAPAVVAARGVVVRSEVEGNPHLLDHVSLEITAGEFLVVSGVEEEIGALLSVLAGYEPPHSGQVLWNGVDLGLRSMEDVAKHGRISEGVFSTSLEAEPDDTVLAYVERPLLLLGYAPAASRVRAAEVLRRFGVVGDDLERPMELTDGMLRERISIAHGMVGDPKILWIEDPTGTLSAPVASVVLKLAASLHRQGRTVVTTSNDDTVIDLATRHVTLFSGRIVA
jgi:ABC-type ATPase involved in cell division